MGAPAFQKVLQIQDNATDDGFGPVWGVFGEFFLHALLAEFDMFEAFFGIWTYHRKLLR